MTYRLLYWKDETKQSYHILPKGVLVEGLAR